MIAIPLGNTTNLVPQQQALEDLVAVITGSLKNIGFFKQVEADEMGLFWRDILARSALSTREARRLETVFRKISGLIAQRGVSVPP